MQIIFILAGLVGLTMLFFGLKWTYMSLKISEVIEFPLANRVKEFEIIKSGLYSLCIVAVAM